VVVSAPPMPSVWLVEGREVLLPVSEGFLRESRDEPGRRLDDRGGECHDQAETGKLAKGKFHDQEENVRKMLILINSHFKNTKYALRAANPRAADRPAGGWPLEGHIVMTP
jgi:hypothetical protein